MHEAESESKAKSVFGCVATVGVLHHPKQDPHLPVIGRPPIPPSRTLVLTAAPPDSVESPTPPCPPRIARESPPQVFNHSNLRDHVL